jgi:hypothetical protein
VLSRLNKKLRNALKLQCTAAAAAAAAAASSSVTSFVGSYMARDYSRLCGLGIWFSEM